MHLLSSHVFDDLVVVLQVLDLFVAEHQVEDHVLVLDPRFVLHERLVLLDIVRVPPPYSIYVKSAETVLVLLDQLPGWRLHVPVFLAAFRLLLRAQVQSAEALIPKCAGVPPRLLYLLVHPRCGQVLLVKIAIQLPVGLGLLPCKRPNGPRTFLTSL